MSLFFLAFVFLDDGGLPNLILLLIETVIKALVWCECQFYRIRALLFPGERALKIGDDLLWAYTQFLCPFFLSNKRKRKKKEVLCLGRHYSALGEGKKVCKKGFFPQRSIFHPSPSRSSLRTNERRVSFSTHIKHRVSLSLS